MKKILIVNWTQRNNVAGGVETRMANLQSILPNSELVSYESLFGNISNYTEAAKKMTEYLEKRYEEDNNILVIRDAATCVYSKIPQITIWANPYAQLGEKFDNNFYREMSQLRMGSAHTTKVTIGTMLINDMKMGEVDDLEKILQTQVPFNGEKCDVCYYSQYNDALAKMLSKPEHGAFV